MSTLVIGRAANASPDWFRVSRKYCHVSHRRVVVLPVTERNQDHEQGLAGPRGVPIFLFVFLSTAFDNVFYFKSQYCLFYSTKLFIFWLNPFCHKVSVKSKISQTTLPNRSRTSAVSPLSAPSSLSSAFFGAWELFIACHFFCLIILIVGQNWALNIYKRPINIIYL